MPTIQIYDCGCVITRPKEASCKTYGTRWRVYVTGLKILLKCRDCGRLRHFVLKVDSPVLVQYTEKEEEINMEDEENVNK